MSGIFKVPKGVTTVTVGPILGGSGGSGGSGADNFVLGRAGGSIATNKIPAHLIVDSSIGGYPLSASNTFQNFVDHTITGQTLMVEHKYPGDVGDGRYTEDHIKKLLMDKLVDAMFKASYIEFTRMEKHDTNEVVFRARIHVVPDTQVRIIREIKDARKTT
jgi:hypothetical protein